MWRPPNPLPEITGKPSITNISCIVVIPKTIPNLKLSLLGKGLQGQPSLDRQYVQHQTLQDPLQPARTPTMSLHDALYVSNLQATTL